MTAFICVALRSCIVTYCHHGTKTWDVLALHQSIRPRLREGYNTIITHQMNAMEDDVGKEGSNDSCPVFPCKSLCQLKGSSSDPSFQVSWPSPQFSRYFNMSQQFHTPLSHAEASSNSHQPTRTSGMLSVS